MTWKLSSFKREFFIGVTLLLTAASAFSETPQLGRDEWLYGKRLYDEGFYDLAAEQLERFIRDYPHSVDVFDAYFLLGEAHLKSGHPELSRAAYLKVALMYPDSPKAPEALFRVGQVLETMGRLEDAALNYLRINGLYPGSNFAAQGLSRASTLFLQSGDTARAENLLGQIVEQYPHSEIADEARLALGKISAAKGNNSQARHFLNRIAASGRDSAAAAARLELARLNRSEWLFAAAAKEFRAVIKQNTDELLAATARLELGDLLNFRGLTRESIEILQPLLNNPDRGIALEAAVKTGDAHYRQGDYRSALQFYDRCADAHPAAALKAAWTAERLRSPSESLKLYLKIARSGGKTATQAAVRAAVIAMKLGEYETAVKMWRIAAADTTMMDIDGRIYYEFGRSLLEAGLGGIDSLAQILTQNRPLSHYQDELDYISALALERNGQYAEAAVRFERLAQRFPASPYADSALASVGFIRNNLIPQERLIEKMADLSARLGGSGGSTKWALAWGDFYLNEFRDPVKAVDQYVLVLDDIIASTAERKHALAASCRAYLQMGWKAARESEPFAAAMFADSARSRWQSLAELNPTDDLTAELRWRLLELDLWRLRDDSELLRSEIDSAKHLIWGGIYGEPPAQLTVDFIDALMNVVALDSVNIRIGWELAQSALSKDLDPRTIARLRFQQVRLLSEQDRLIEADDSAKRLAGELPFTSGGAMAAWWVIESNRTAPEERLTRLNAFRESYPYLIEPTLFYSIQSELLSALGRPLDALEAQEQVRRAQRWGLPELDILEVPDNSVFYRRGLAFMRAGQYDRAAAEFRSLLNIEPKNDPAPDAMVNLAQIKAFEQNWSASLAYLDTLESRFPSSPALTIGARIKPRVLFAAKNYALARQAFLSAYDIENNSDSAFTYLSEAIVCLYRLNRLDDARNDARTLYSQFKNHPELENVKARFYLEKGLALIKMRNFDEARREFKVILDKYPLSPYTDDASYNWAVSYLSQDNLEEGVNRLTAFIENFPNSDLITGALLSLGTAQHKRGKYSDAIAALSRVWSDSAAGDNCLAAYEGLLAAYRDLRYWDAAIRLTRDYLERYPNAADALDRRMDIAHFYMQLGEWNEAIRNYRPLLPVADAEREAEIQFYIGECYMNSGDFRSAILEFLKVEVLGRKTQLDWGVTAIYNAGLCYEKLNDLDGAARMFNRIIQISGAESNYGRAAQKRLNSLGKAGG